MSLVFPNISKPQYPLEMELEDTSISSVFEDGAVQTRRKFTKSRNSYILKWELLPKSEFDALIDFIKNDAKFRCNSFQWTNPASRVAANQELETKEVRIVEVRNISLVKVNYYTITLKIQEV